MFISLHYSAPADRDDVVSAIADKTMLRQLGIEDILPVVITHQKDQEIEDDRREAFLNTWPDAIMIDKNNWLDGARQLADIWSQKTDIQIKEGGTSNLTYEALKLTNPGVTLVQHSEWNERETDDAKLAWVRANTSYVKIRNGNKYLRIKKRTPESEAFKAAARAHPVLGDEWDAAFDFYGWEKKGKLDFSDTSELMHILGLGEMSIVEYQNRFLTGEPPEDKYTFSSTPTSWTVSWDGQFVTWGA